MNLREELYKSGAGLTVRVVYSRKGGRVYVLDEARRTKAAILALLRTGHSPRDTARALDMPLAVVCSLGLAALRERNVWKKSYSGVASVGINP